MHTGRIFYLLGRIVSIIGLTMFMPLICTILCQGPDLVIFAVCLPLTTGCGIILSACCRKYKTQTLRHRDSFLLVTLCWLSATFFGALPYIFYGVFPDLASAIFESISGFSTTGATAMTDIEIMPKGILLWRSLTHWLGGAGIVLLFVSLIQHDTRGGEGVSMFKAEFSGGMLAERVTPRIEDNAKAIACVYLGLTFACFIALLLAGMDIFDALNHSFSTIATGGFSTKNLSIAAYNSPAIEWVIAVFMVISSVNFALYYMLIVRHQVRKVFANPELRLFLFIVVLTTIITTIPLARQFYTDENWLFSLRKAFFQVTTIMSTAGFTTANYDLWPDSSRFVLLILMFVGGCAGSAAGSIKTNRWYIAGMNTKSELIRLIRPNQTLAIHYNGRAVPEGIVRSISHYFFMFFTLTLLGGLLLSLLGMDISEAFYGALTTIANVGPGCGSIGPIGNYADITPACKLIMSFLMLVGRLEIYTVMALFIPAIWKK